MRSFLVLSILVFGHFSHILCVVYAYDSSYKVDDNLEDIASEHAGNPFGYQIALWISIFVIATFIITIFAFISSTKVCIYT